MRFVLVISVDDYHMVMRLLYELTISYINLYVNCDPFIAVNVVVIIISIVQVSFLPYLQRRLYQFHFLFPCVLSCHAIPRMSY